MPPPEKPLPRPKPPKPKPPKPKPKPKKPKTGPAAEAKPTPEELERDRVPINGGVPVLPQPFSAACSTYRLCPPPPSPPATVHLRSGRLPTPLIAVSASLLALSAVLLLTLLFRWLVRRRHGQQQHHAPQDQEAPLAQDGDEDESVLGVDTTAWGQEEEGEEVDSGDVHHVWFIRTKGLDERAIAAIAAVVYDAAKMKQQRGGAGDGDDGGCAVCLAEFRDGETLRLLPRCGHAFHRGCIDTWLRAHVNCPLCRAPVQVHVTAGATAAWVRSQQAEAASRGAALAAGARTEEEGERAERGAVAAEPAVRRAASMVTIPRRAWPDVAVPAASSSGREEDMTGLAKIRRMLKLSDALAGVGRSMSFGAGTCQRLPTRSSGSSTAAAGGVNSDESR